MQLKAFPRRLKPGWFDSLYGAAEAAPFQNSEFVIDWSFFGAERSRSFCAGIEALRKTRFRSVCLADSLV